jgi:hypothetical protein
MSDDAFLCLDRNGNGVIDDGAELFGNATLLPNLSRAQNGWIALEVLDQSSSGGTEDGVLDSRDQVFPRLLLWRDSNHDGVSQPSELFNARDIGLVAIDLRYRSVGTRDRFGNLLRYRGTVLWNDGSIHEAVDVIFTDRRYSKKSDFWKSVKQYEQ